MNSGETHKLDTTTDLDTIFGWFYASDRDLFRWFLQRQLDADQAGGLVELGCYLGKSTVLMGDYARPGENFTVVDLFEEPADNDANSEENRASYSGLTRDTFEANYLLFHDILPTVHADFSSAVTKFVEPGSVRFLHIDASHLYDQVAEDVECAHTLLAPDGIVVFDDVRSEHTPGVTAAAWEAVLNKGMRPIALTECKMYATWGETEAVLDDLRDYLEGNERAWWESQQVAGHTVIRCKVSAPTPATHAPSAASTTQRQKPTKVQRQAAVIKARDEEIRALRSSVSFRLGRALTAPGRRLRRR